MANLLIDSLANLAETDGKVTDSDLDMKVQAALFMKEVNPKGVNVKPEAPTLSKYEGENMRRSVE